MATYISIRSSSTLTTNYYIYESYFEFQGQIDGGETRDYFTMLAEESLQVGLSRLVGESGHLSLDFI